ncbi:MAG: hypothetical protein J1E43_08565 [Christensenellaceae bacterium]|nr:hypothetical protein [Christensenellaceae bacterium]
MIRKLRFAVSKTLRSEPQTMGLLFALLALAVMLAGLLASPRLGTVDTGKYEPIMRAAGLKHSAGQQAEGGLLYSRVIETYAYGHFSFAKLLAPLKSGSILYPIALIRLLTQPLGLAFSTLYLYWLYAALAALAVYLIVESAAHLWGRLGVIPGLFLLLLLSDRNLTACFGSLYETGTLIVALLLFTGCVFRAFTYRRGSGFGAVVPVVMASAFLLNACSRAAVFAPVAVAAAAGLTVQEWPLLRGKRVSAALLLFLLCCSVYSSVGYLTSDPDNASPAAVYHAVFQGILPASDNPQRDLAELGLDESYLADIGKSFYQDAADYAHDPKDELEAEALFSAISTRRVLRWYAGHPGRFLRTVLGTISGMNTMESGSALGVGQHAQSTRRTTRSGSLLETLMKLLLPGGCGFFLSTAGAGFLLAAGLWGWRVIRGRNRRTGWIVPLILMLACAAMAMFLPLHIALMGPDSLEQDRIASVFMLMMLWGGLSFAAGRAVAVGSVWFRKIYDERDDLTAEEAIREQRRPRRSPASARARACLQAVASSRRRTVLAVLILALIMVCSIQFARPRAGTVNNGDYGRMMEQLGLTWSSEVYYDLDAQAGHQVIEEYAYRSGMDFAALTFLKPTYSLVYPAAIVRGFCAVSGLPFSTWYMSLVMSAALVLCILSVTRDLHTFFGRYTLVTGVGLCLILLSESYLVWFNSLFGEGCILLGLMMALACCVRLSVLPQGKGVPWVFALAFASMFLTTAKAQMLVALPVLLILLALFALYHRPLHIGRLVAFLTACILCMGLISYKAVRVYQDNSRVSERHTVWQSLFYGALMSSSDPLGDMEELGIPLEMAADIGKHAYYPDEAYVIAPTSPEADAALYDHVNTFTMIGYYLKRPLQLLRMLDYTVGESQEVYNGFRAYLGQDYADADADAVDRWGLWLYWRPLFAFGHFWEYALVYGALLIWAIQRLRSRKLPLARKWLIATWLGVMLIGALQFPLTTVGNGFADNHKQLFGFLLCHDLLLALGAPKALIGLKRLLQRLNVR